MLTKKDCDRHLFLMGVIVFLWVESIFHFNEVIFGLIFGTYIYFGFYVMLFVHKRYEMTSDRLRGMTNYKSLTVQYRLVESAFGKYYIYCKVDEDTFLSSPWYKLNERLCNIDAETVKKQDFYKFCNDHKNASTLFNTMVRNYSEDTRIANLEDEHCDYMRMWLIIFGLLYMVGMVFLLCQFDNYLSGTVDELFGIHHKVYYNNNDYYYR